MSLLAFPRNIGFHPSSPLVRTKRHPKPTSSLSLYVRGVGSRILKAVGSKWTEQSPLISEISGGKRRGAVAVVRASSENLIGGHKILLSDVVVKQRKVDLKRKWNFLDKAAAGFILFVHVLCLFAPFTFNWGAFWVAFALYVMTGLGITLSFHRNLSHRSFKLPTWLEYFFAYCGLHALQGTPMAWVSTHRYHHQFCDSDRDPHSPTEGFWFSHMSWLFYHDSLTEKCGEPDNIADLQEQPFYRFLSSTYIVHPIALAALLYALGGFTFLVWGMGVRLVCVYHFTWLINSASHVWGHRAWNTDDLSKNNWWLALLTFGEGWHNNHHAFGYSARVGLEWWQLDMTWYVIRLFEAVGLATDVKVPLETHRQSMAISN